MYIYRSKRLKNFFTDTSSRSSIENDIIKKNVKFDLIIEDASHMLKDQIISLFILFKILKPGGYFIIEEIDFPERGGYACKSRIPRFKNNFEKN